MAGKHSKGARRLVGVLMIAFLLCVAYASIAYVRHKAYTHPDLMLGNGHHWKAGEFVGGSHDLTHLNPHLRGAKHRRKGHKGAHRGDDDDETVSHDFHRAHEGGAGQFHGGERASRGVIGLGRDKYGPRIHHRDSAAADEAAHHAAAHYAALGGAHHGKRRHQRRDEASAAEEGAQQSDAAGGLEADGAAGGIVGKGKTHQHHKRQRRVGADSVVARR